MDKKYEIIIFWSSEDNAYVAEVPELAGCMADGKTYREALGNAEQIIEEWIETATKLGRPIPQACRGVVQRTKTGPHSSVPKDRKSAPKVERSSPQRSAGFHI